jgi:type I restriction enzyme S subunit
MEANKTKKALVPKLRFKEFDEISTESSYKKHLFNDIFLFSTGKNIKQNEASLEFETPCIRYGELYHMYNEVINEIFNRTNLDKSELHFSQGDEILLPSAGEDPLDIGSASALTIKNVAIGRTINILKPLKANIYSQIYVSYYINQKLRKKISTLAKGVSISNVYNSDLKLLEIILPTLPEQQKIAAFLSAVDEKIQLLTRKKELLEQYKKGVMQQLLTGKLRFKIKNEVGELVEPPKWEEKRLGDFMFERNIQAPKSDKYPLMAFMQNVGVAPKGERYNREFLVNDEDNKKYKKTEYGDFIYSSNNLDTGSIGLNRYGPASISPVYSIFHTDKTCDYNFVSEYFTRREFISKMIRFRQGVVYGQWRIHESEFLKIIERIPCLLEQQKIASFLTTIDTQIENVSKQITQIQSYKKGLLQQMFV